MWWYFNIVDNGNKIKEVPLSEADTIEYKANELGVHYIQTIANIKSCKANFDYATSLCPGWI